MKTLLICIIIFISVKGVAQLHSGTPVIQSKAQPVPNSSTAEKSAPPQHINIPPAANPVPPIYPGANVKAVEIPRQLINPPSIPSGTQPKQKEPLSPVESTNRLQPNRPPREEASRINRSQTVPVNIVTQDLSNSNNNYNSNRASAIYNNNKPSTTRSIKKAVPGKSIVKKKTISYKKPH